MSIIGSIFRSHAGWETGSSNHDLAGVGIWGSRKTTSGEHVSPGIAMGLPAYFACMRVISEDVSTLPLKTYRRLKPRGKASNMDHPAAPLLHEQANPEMSAQAMREVITSHAMGWHGGFGEIERRNNGNPLAIWPIHPSRATIKRDENGNLYYAIKVDASDARLATGLAVNEIALKPKDILHIHGMSDDGVSGMPIPLIGREAIGAGLALQKYTSAFFGNGGSPGGVLQHPSTLKGDAVKTLRESWSEHHSGGGNAHKPAVLEEGMEWKQITVDPIKAQAIEARHASVEDIARLFRMPPHKIQHLLRSTFSNIEHQSIEYVQDTLYPWLIRWEQEIDRKLFGGKADADVFAEHLVTARLRGDQKTRAEFYHALWGMGALSPDDILELENRNPLPDGLGSHYFVPMNMQPLEHAIKEPEPVPEQLAAPVPPPAEPDDDQADQAAKQAEAATVPLARSLQRLVTKEANAMKRLAHKHAAGSRAFIPAAKEFYAKHRADVSEELGAWFVAMERFGVAVTETEEAYAARHCEESESQVCNAMKVDGEAGVVAVCNEWTTDRAGNAARGLVQGTDND